MRRIVRTRTSDEYLCDVGCGEVTGDGYAMQVEV